jgi:hypothetical protein
MTEPLPKPDQESTGRRNRPPPTPPSKRPALTPAQRSQRARIAALARWSREDPTLNAQRGQRGLRASIAAGLELPSDLGPDERERRIDAAVRAHMSRLALASSRARSANRRSNQ